MAQDLVAGATGSDASVRTATGLGAGVIRLGTAASGGLASVFAGLSLLLLAACAETQLAAHLASSADDGEVRGRYKVGNPYEINGVWYVPQEDFHYEAVGIASWYGPGFHGRRTANGEIFDQDALTAAHTTLQMPTIVRVTNLENGRSVVVRVNDRGPFVGNRVIDLSRRSAELLGFRRAGTARVRVQVLTEESVQLAETYGQQVELGRRAGTGGVVAAASGAAPRPVAAVPQRRTASSPRGPLAAPAAVASQRPTAPLQEPAHVRPVAPDPAAGAVAVVPASATAGRMPAPAAVPPTPPPSAAVTDIFVQVGAFTVYENADRLRRRLTAIGRVTIATVAVDGVDFHRVRIGPFSSVDRANAALARAIAEGHGEARLIAN